ncbi:ATP-binding domain-containing protein [Dactylosporangium sp. NPDC005572]|uniref:HelD family protein n=1 Tax=Dactylosporangium sp. NPDC005572 TaxID=3156889 RepID=UPI0033B6486B
MLYGRLDRLREQAAQRLAGLLREPGGTPEARSQRDAAAAMYAERVARYDAVEPGLCFGRLDLRDGGHRHIGRIGIFDDEGDFEPLLVDWRAPAARPFYVATAARPDGVAQRRHIRTRGRTVVGLDDEVLDLDRAEAGTRDLTGEAALLAALTAKRTGRMKDIVETIQAEQDRVIRADLGGVLVVQGGPGTGKTAVALHRAAYLLYTHREQLSARGVLIVGPNAAFLRYISQVLPSLAETGVLLATLGDLYPGITARRAEPAAVAEVKGRTSMADVLAAAVRDRQVVPAEAIPVDVSPEVLLLQPDAVEAARHRARRSGQPHNVARPLFVDAVLGSLAEQVAERVGHDPFWDDPLGAGDALDSPNLLDAADLADIRADLAAEPAVRAVLDELWPVLTPEALLTGLFGSADALASAAPQLSAADRELLRRDPAGGWSPADVPLLDEAAELLGEDDSAARARAAALHRASLEYAQGVLDITAGSMSFELEDDPEAAVPNVASVMDADALAARYATGERLGAAARAAADRRWAFGHVIVDEAQELPAMAWRLLMRRCPSRSMTVVGDLAQTGALSGPASWGEMFAPYVADRWRAAELTVSYRTPAEIMDVAARVLAGIDPSIVPPRPVRSSGVEPWDATGPLEHLAGRVAALVDELGDGRFAVISPAALVPVLSSVLPGVAVGDQPDLDRTVVLLTVAQAKGLEFDGVVVADPDGIVAESPRGASDLYVALTRATQRLGVFRPTGTAPTG